MAKPQRLPKRLIQTTKAKLTVDELYGAAWTAYWRKLQPLTDDVFWPLLVYFRKLIFDNLADSRRDPVELAADEFFRMTLTGESADPAGGSHGKHPKYDFVTACRFVESYEAVEEQLATALDVEAVDLGRSDDGFSDLLDSLPLAGETVYTDITSGLVNNDHTLRRVLAEVGKFTREQVAFVADGENYVTMRLRDAAKDKLPALDQVQEETDE